MKPKHQIVSRVITKGMAVFMSAALAKAWFYIDFASTEERIMVSVILAIQIATIFWIEKNPFLQRD